MLGTLPPPATAVVWPLLQGPGAAPVLLLGAAALLRWPCTQ